MPVPDWHDMPEMENWVPYQLIRLVHVMGRCFQHQASTHGLKRMPGTILGLLRERVPDGMTATELSRKTMVTAASMSATLAHLEQEGLIRREPNPDDARSMLVFLTPQGIDRVSIFLRIIKTIDQEIMQGFTAEERELLRSFLERINHNLAASQPEAELMCNGKKTDKETQKVG